MRGPESEPTYPAWSSSRGAGGDMRLPTALRSAPGRVVMVCEGVARTAEDEADASRRRTRRAHCSTTATTRPARSGHRRRYVSANLRPARKAGLYASQGRRPPSSHVAGPSRPPSRRCSRRERTRTSSARVDDGEHEVSSYRSSHWSVSPAVSVRARWRLMTSTGTAQGGLRDPGARSSSGMAAVRSSLVPSLSTRERHRGPWSHRSMAATAAAMS
jgi:hypothetical protein